MKLTVVIPSYKRSHDLPGKDYFSFAKYVIPESQKADYLKVLPTKRLIIIPDEHDGSITKKRNWILAHLPRPLIMLDDDVRRITYTEYEQIGENEYRCLSCMEYPKEHVLAFFENACKVAEEFGVKLWGVNQNSDPIAYRTFKPFSLTNLVLGPLQGHLDHDLTFDDAMGTKDDYDMAIQQLNQFKKVLRLNKYAYECKHGDNEGGIVSQRSLAKEEEYCMAIMKKWGTKIIRYKLPPKKMVDLLNAHKVNIPIAGV